MTTLLDLVAALVEAGASDREVVASVFDLVHRGRVRLLGQVVEEELMGHSLRRSDPPSGDDAPRAAPSRRPAVDRPGVRLPGGAIARRLCSASASR